MPLSLDETSLISRLALRQSTNYNNDDRLTRYYDGVQRLLHLGLAVPPELRRFETVVNWPRVSVDSLEERLDLRTIMLPGEDQPDESLREGWDANNWESESSLLHLDTLVLGRGVVCAGVNPEDKDHPLITVESPRQFSYEVHPTTRRVTAALRMYGATSEVDSPRYATLYTPDATVWLEKDQSRWNVVDRDDHRLGRVPVVVFLNRRRTGDWAGRSEMDDVIPLTDAAARSLTNLQLAGETHAVPRRWALGLSQGDFVDGAGNVLPAWEAYFGAIWAASSKDAKFGQFDASDLRNFHETVNHYASLVASVTGLPMRYLGQSTVNPPSADGIRADEARLIKRAERKQRALGDGHGWVMSLYHRLRTGEWIDGNRVKVAWYDAATPTSSQQADRVQKLTGRPILSVEGGWDELGWSDARKAIERGYLAAEAASPIIPAEPAVPIPA